MKVEVIKKHVDYLGSKGAVRDIPKNEAEVHITLGNVKKYVAPNDSYVVSTVEAKRPRKKTKRTYRRRDMTAESNDVSESSESTIDQPSDQGSTE
jgi:hypothetical protein